MKDTPEIDTLRRDVEEAKRSERAWEDTAAFHLRNEEFYHGLLTQIGEQFGVAAKTSDDGSVHQNVVALKVPELTASLHRVAQVCYDLHDALGVKWGEDPYDAIEGLKTGQTTERMLREFCGWLSGDIPELHAVEVPILAESLDRYLARSVELGHSPT